MASFTDTTTDAFVEITGETNMSDGLKFVGGIKNTGVTNSMTVKITVTDMFGTTDSQSFVVNSLVKLNFDSLISAITTAQPPYCSILIEVQSTVAGLSTTYAMHTLTW
jgi:hypothetical protein